LKRFFVIVCALGALALYGFWFEPSRIRVVEHDIAGADGRSIFAQPLRIAVIGDLHAGAPYIDEAKVDRVVALTNAARPDLILLAGDYVVFAVIGNHDRWEDAAHIENALTAVGIVVLENKSLEIARDDDTVRLVGVSDSFTTVPNLTAAFADVPDGTRALCFTHSPDIFLTLPQTCALTIAAHTHGGQVWLPLLGRPIVPSRFGQRYAAGLVHENGKALFVSTGIGTSIIPVRFGVMPEISLLNVK
jgi:predicted MPP superfamily phosphohydrolase